MFFKRRRKKDDEELFFASTELTEQKMPIIILDHSWHQLLKEIKTPQLEALEKKLNDLLKKQGKYNTDYIEYSRMKKDMLDTILKLTEEAFGANSKEAHEKINDQKKMVLKINEKLEEIENHLDTLPQEIQQVNGYLVDQSVQLCYNYMNQYKLESEELEEEIQNIRSTLMKKTEKKKAYDQKAEQLYQYLHRLVGPGFIEKLDNKFWEKKT